MTDFFTEQEVLAMLKGFRVKTATQDHYRALPIARTGFKASVYKTAFRPLYNLLPLGVAKKLAYKFSVTAIKA